MSLISLTFGNKNAFEAHNKNAFEAGNKNAFEAEHEIILPQSGMQPGIQTSAQVTVVESSKFQLKKVTRFYGLQEFLLIGEVLNGAIKVGMHCNVNGLPAKVLEVESKHGKCARKGTAGIMIIGIDPDSLQANQELSFC